MFKKGQSGNPKGRAVEKNKKAFTDALNIVLKENDGKSGKLRLRKVAEKLVTCAENGEGWAIKEIADRIEGKPAQIITGDENAAPIQIILTKEEQDL